MDRCEPKSLNVVLEKMNLHLHRATMQTDSKCCNYFYASIFHNNKLHTIYFWYQPIYFQEYLDEVVVLFAPSKVDGDEPARLGFELLERRQGTIESDWVIEDLALSAATAVGEETG